MSDAAIAQAKLILENDFNLEGHIFRIKIDGKGCGGFDYALGFTLPEKDDLELAVTDSFHIHIDPFTAYYARTGVIEYIFDPSQDIEGFAYINPDEKKFRGKFFKNEEMVPEI